MTLQELLGGITPGCKTRVKPIVHKLVGVILLEYDQSCCKERSLVITNLGPLIGGSRGIHQVSQKLPLFFSPLRIPPADRPHHPSSARTIF